MPKEGLVDVLWEGGSMCMSGGVGSIPRSIVEMGESSGNDRRVGEGMSDPRHGCGVGGWMLGVGYGCGVDGEGSRVGTTQGIATSGRGRRPARVALVLGLLVLLAFA